MHYDHISNLATGCGFKPSDVQAVIESDNNQRRAQASVQLTTTNEEGESDPRFELDPNDELTSEEEDA